MSTHQVALVHSQRTEFADGGQRFGCSSPRVRQDLSTDIICPIQILAEISLEPTVGRRQNPVQVALGALLQHGVWLACPIACV